MELLKEKLNENDLIVSFRMKDSDFTRNRKQSFSQVLLFMFNLIRKSLGIEIDNFVRFMTDRLSHQKVSDFTSSAFVQNRKKINPEVFKFLSEIVVDNFYQLESQSLNLFHGFRVLAVDGSLITLPNQTSLKQEFGVSKNQTNTEIIQARASILYDVLNKIVLDSSLTHIDSSERELALMHKNQWKSKDLIIYDRGYTGFNLYREHIKQSVDFLIRVKITESNIVKDFVKSKKKSLITEIAPCLSKSLKNKEYDIRERIKIRLIRIELCSGEIEVLITSLIDSKKYPHKMFKELYFKRWGIETLYDELKNKLKIEYFTGYSKQSILQDFNCAIFISNLQSVIINDLKEEIEIKNNNKKYEYKINTNLSYGLMKNRILELLCSETPIEIILKELEKTLLKHIVPIRPNRSNDRNTTKYRTRTKPKVLKNQKDAI